MQRRSSRLVVYLASIFLLWTIAAPSAHAYIDPGSTNFIIQIVIGAAAGAGLAIATFWRRIAAFFSKKKAASEPQSSASAAAPVAPPVAPPAAPAPVAPPTPAAPPVSPAPAATPAPEAPANPPASSGPGSPAAPEPGTASTDASTDASTAE
jgi:hypothetical protein